MQEGEKSRPASPVAVEGEKEKEKESANESGNINDVIAEVEGTEGSSNELESENVSASVEAPEAPGQ